MKKYKILFADLDGTLINTITGNTFPKGIWDMQFNFVVLDKIKELNPDYIFIVSNQDGLDNEEHFRNKMTYVLNSIKEYLNQMNIIDSMYCSCNDENSDYRKPNTGMLEVLYGQYHLKERYTINNCLMIGDSSGKPGQFSDSDKQTAINFGIDYMDVEDFINEQIN